MNDWSATVSCWDYPLLRGNQSKISWKCTCSYSVWHSSLHSGLRKQCWPLSIVERTSWQFLPGGGKPWGTTAGNWAANRQPTTITCKKHEDECKADKWQHLQTDTSYCCCWIWGFINYFLGVTHLLCIRGHEIGIKIKNGHPRNRTPSPKVMPNSVSMVYVCVP